MIYFSYSKYISTRKLKSQSNIRHKSDDKIVMTN